MVLPDVLFNVSYIYGISVSLHLWKDIKFLYPYAAAGRY